VDKLFFERVTSWWKNGGQLKKTADNRLKEQAVSEEPRKSIPGFIGIHKSTIQDGNRLILPARYRNLFRELGDTAIVVALGFDGNLCLYRESYWNRMIERYTRPDTLPTNEKHRQVMRALFAFSDRVRIDASGRIVIPVEILGQTRLRTRVVVLGVGTHLEVWRDSYFEHYLDSSKLAPEKLAEELYPMDFQNNEPVARGAGEDRERAEGPENRDVSERTEPDA